MDEIWKSFANIGKTRFVIEKANVSLVELEENYSLCAFKI